MSPIEVRPFRRSDRDQLTQLVNAHAAAVVPGMGASVSAVLSSLERRPGEFIEDPWVSERVTLVAQQHDRIAAAAHLLRYFADERAGIAARDLGAIEWFLFWPEAPAGRGRSRRAARWSARAALLSHRSKRRTRPGSSGSGLKAYVMQPASDRDVRMTSARLCRNCSRWSGSTTKCPATMITSYLLRGGT